MTLLKPYSSDQYRQCVCFGTFLLSPEGNVLYYCFLLQIWASKSWLLLKCNAKCSAMEESGVWGGNRLVTIDPHRWPRCRRMYQTWVYIARDGTSRDITSMVSHLVLRRCLFCTTPAFTIFLFLHWFKVVFVVVVSLNERSLDVFHGVTPSVLSKQLFHFWTSNLVPPPPPYASL